MHGEIEEQILDAAERELIRQKLLCYMKDKRIGVPRLAELIQEAHPRKKEVTVKTLQRFLAGLIRTNDASVAVCQHFAEHLTASDPVAKLGERLSIFYGTGNGRDYSGAYSGTSEFAMKSKGVQAPISSDIVISADVGFWRVQKRQSLLLTTSSSTGSSFAPEKLLLLC